MNISYAKVTPHITLEQASETVRKKSKGKVLSARTIRTINGTKIHKIKILTPDGRVKMHSVHDRLSPENDIYSGNKPNINRSSNYRINNASQKPQTSRTTTKKQ